MTGLEPESINMTIGNDLIIALNQIFTLLKGFSHKSLDLASYFLFFCYDQFSGSLQIQKLGVLTELSSNGRMLYPVGYQ